MTETTITFDYQPSNVESGYSTLVINNLDLMPSYWHHVTVTVYQDDFGLYINGSIVNATGLEAAIMESSNTVFLGQVAPGSDAS